MPKKRTEVLKQRDQDIEKDYFAFMPRQPRLDAPGILHHVMEEGRYWGATTSAVIRLAVSEELPGLKQCRKLF